jgi:hypothetical protein
MCSLSSHSPQEAQSALSRARTILESNEGQVDKTRYGALVSLTLNNQACYYNTQKKPNVALSLLAQSVLEAEKHGCDNAFDRAGTLLNVSAILSRKDRYTK